VYGPVRTVVWEGRSCEAPPYPDRSDFVPWPIVSFRCYPAIGGFEAMRTSTSRRARAGAWQTGSAYAPSRLASATAITQTAKPDRARAEPTRPVDVQPKPAAIAIPPSHGPSALAVLNAE
jgi:hypothetical protein